MEDGTDGCQIVERDGPGRKANNKTRPLNLAMASLASSSSSAGLTRAPTMLEQLLEEINFQRTKELRQMLKDGSYATEAVRPAWFVSFRG